MKYRMNMVWLSLKIAWSRRGDHGHYFNVIRTLIIQPTLLISTQLVVRYFLTRNMLNKSIRNYPKTFNKKDLSPKNEITKNNKKL